MEPDEAADLLGDMPPHRAQAVLGNPDYNINQQFNYTDNPYDGTVTYSPANSVFVGPANINRNNFV